MLRRLARRKAYSYLGEDLKQGLRGGGKASTILVERDREIKLGEASIRVSRDGSLEACDQYGCYTVALSGDEKIEVKPVPAVYRLQRFSPYIYVEFEKPLYARRGSIYWARIPVDLEVYVDSTLLGVLATSSVKYTLIGDIVGGFVCRYFKSSVKHLAPERSTGASAGLLAFRVKTRKEGGVVLPGIGFNALRSSLYSSPDNTIYYSWVEVEVEEDRLTARVQEKPPRKGLVQVYKPRHVGLTAVQYMQPFTMQL